MLRLDEILRGLSGQGRNRLLLRAVQNGIISDEKYFVEVVEGLIKEGVFSVAEEIARNLGYREVSERLMRAEIAGACRREAYGAAEDLQEKKLTYPDELKETPEGLKGLLENAEKIEEAVEKSNKLVYNCMYEVGGISVPGPAIKKVRKYKKFLKEFRNSITNITSKLKEYGHPDAAAEILETVLGHEMGGIVYRNMPRETQFEWQNLLIDCYVDVDDSDRLLKAGISAANYAKTYKKIADAKWNNGPPEEKAKDMEAAIHFSKRAYELFEGGEGWKEAIELAQCMGDKKREGLYLSLVDFLKPTQQKVVL